jgi:hypothetical protein
MKVRLKQRARLTIIWDMMHMEVYSGLKKSGAVEI